MISRIGLANFRRFEEASFPLARRTLFTGANGAGKTTILEAIHLLATTLSFRTRRDGDLIRAGARGGARVVGILSDGERREVRLRPRAYFIGREAVPRMDFLGALRVTPLLPGDLALIQGAPAVRRRFLDLAIAQTTPGYGRSLLEVRRLERQRRRAIATGGRGLKVWNRLLAERAPRIIEARRAAAERLAAAFREEGKRFFETRALTLAYRGVEAVTEESAARALEAAREEEVRTGRPRWATTRWDLDLFLEGRSLSRFGSQGECRASALALRLAAARLLGEGVLLVDDVWGEIDEARRGGLLSAVAEEKQVVLASVAPDALAKRLDGLEAIRLDATPTSH